MLRQAFGVLGLLVALTGVLLLGAVGSGGLSPLNLAWAVAYVAAGALVAAGGLVPRDRLGSVRPSKLLGAGILLFGLVNVLQGLQALLESLEDLNIFRFIITKLLFLVVLCHIGGAGK